MKLSEKRGFYWEYSEILRKPKEIFCESYDTMEKKDGSCKRQDIPKRGREI